MPLAAATVLAAAIAYGMSILTVCPASPAGHGDSAARPRLLRHQGAGPAIALAVIGVTLPLLRRMTGPDNARFE